MTKVRLSLLKKNLLVQLTHDLIEYKNINSLSHLEEIKEKDDFRINEFDSFYKPYEFCAFHELFYFNNMNARRLESKNSSTGSFSGNLKAIILDPFITKTKKINPNNTR